MLSPLPIPVRVGRADLHRGKSWAPPAFEAVLVRSRDLLYPREEYRLGRSAHGIGLPTMGAKRPQVCQSSFEPNSLGTGRPRT